MRPTDLSRILMVAIIGILLSGLDGRAVSLLRSRSCDTILIAPARPHVLQFAFDLANMRDVTLVSFRGKVNAAEPLMHVWTGNEWQYVSFDDFCSMRFVSQPPKTVIVIGDDQIVPKALLQGMVWSCKIERLPTINAADLINGLNPYFEFSSREWKRLAKLYDLKLEDVNEPRRAFNPYDIPRSKMPLEARDSNQGKSDAPPAVLIEKSGDRNNKAPDPSTLK